MEGFEIEDVDEAQEAMYQGGCHVNCLSEEDLEE